LSGHRRLFVRDGWFDEVDAAFHNHIAGNFSVGYGLIQAALLSATLELGGVAYRSLLPAGQKPPVGLNRATMEKFRPQMKRHYLDKKPIFVS
jgi:metal-dependent amidase/aminoacylase/carboxypeptidase family protein